MSALPHDEIILDELIALRRDTRELRRALDHQAQIREGEHVRALRLSVVAAAFITLLVEALLHALPWGGS